MKKLLFLVVIYAFFVQAQAQNEFFLYPGDTLNFPLTLIGCDTFVVNGQSLLGTLQIVAENDPMQQFYVESCDGCSYSIVVYTGIYAYEPQVLVDSGQVVLLWDSTATRQSVNIDIYSLADGQRVRHYGSMHFGQTEYQYLSGLLLPGEYVVIVETLAYNDYYNHAGFLDHKKKYKKFVSVGA